MEEKELHLPPLSNNVPVTQKIEELHGKMKQFFTSKQLINSKALVPKIEKLLEEIDAEKKELAELKDKNSIDQQKRTLLIEKAALTQDIQKNIKAIEKAKKTVLKSSLQKQCLTRQLGENETILDTINQPYKESTMITNIKFDISLLGKENHALDEPLPYRTSERTYKIFLENKWKKLEELADKIKGSNIAKIEELLYEKRKGIAARKIFKNYSADPYFDELVRKTQVIKQVYKLSEGK